MSGIATDGTELQPTRCPNGHASEPGDAFCRVCGTQLSDPAWRTSAALDNNVVTAGKPAEQTRAFAETQVNRPSSSDTSVLPWTAFARWSRHLTWPRRLLILGCVVLTVGAVTVAAVRSHRGDQTPNVDQSSSSSSGSGDVSGLVRDLEQDGVVTCVAVQQQQGERPQCQLDDGTQLGLFVGSSAAVASDVAEFTSTMCSSYQANPATLPLALATGATWEVIPELAPGSSEVSLAQSIAEHLHGSLVTFPSDC
jgi:hypothetical protein